ncbi:MAG: hypothetical protein HY707_07465 [Ignavibacteriae bacterium]|nr:hypothetical protein [Ignavibacteriota bacterium]
MKKMSDNAEKKGISASPHSEDVTSVDAIIKAMYESVSFTAGSQPDYKRLRSLFHPEGRLIPPKTERDSSVHVLDVENFITRSRDYVVITGLERRGFIEKEIFRRADGYGKIVHVLSTYESRHRETDPAPIQRGVNIIQLLKEHNRWWVVSVMWDIERPSVPIPPKYLPADKV